MGQRSDDDRRFAEAPAGLLTAPENSVLAVMGTLLLRPGQHLSGDGRVVTVPADDAQTAAARGLAAYAGRDTAPEPIEP